MTGFIKPSEIYAAQKKIVELLQKTGDGVTSLDEETRKFMMIHPVTKRKESGRFREVDGVFVTEESYEEAESLRRPMDEVVMEAAKGGD